LTCQIDRQAKARGRRFADRLAAALAAIVQNLRKLAEVVSLPVLLATSAAADLVRWRANPFARAARRRGESRLKFSQTEYGDRHSQAHILRVLDKKVQE
jgi:hypothetical protein